MADEWRQNVSDSSETDEIESCDPRLDFLSDKFDPLLALTVPSINIPNPDAKKYDNLAIYESASKSKNDPQRQKTSKKKQEPEVEVKRRWLPHQLPISTEGRSRKKKKNVLTRMEAAVGPLAVLRKCIAERIQIKIWTRNHIGVRGYCIGYLVAFDKHWNLALEDVFEFWTRPKKRKVPAFGGVEEEHEPRIRIRPPKVKVTPHETDKKLENCCRRVNQMMMRGEHVVIVRLLNEDEVR